MQTSEVPGLTVIENLGSSNYSVVENGSLPGIVDHDVGNHVIVETPNSPEQSIHPVLGHSVSLSWHNLNVEAVLPGPSCFARMRTVLCHKGDAPVIGSPKRQILQHVSGTALPGSLLAIMGASGAGKTSLLNILARQNLKNLHIEGSILVNGRDIGSQVKSISAYCQQEDLFIGTLTVKEHLYFQALLRMDISYSVLQRKTRVKEVMKMLGLNKCMNTIIGVPGRIRGISGGELKRLSFASEIITNPNLLFVDEPTSGLDSFMAESVITALKGIAAEGKTVLATIHQPSSDIFLLFDRLLLMSEGRTAFLGSTQDAISFFERAGFPCPMNFNPADHYVHTMAIVPGREEECRKKAAAICDLFEAERSQPSLKPQRSTSDALKSFEDGRSKLHEFRPDEFDKPRYKRGWFGQLQTVLWRASMSNLREPYVSKLRVIQAISIGLICGLVYLGQDEDMEGVENINGALFFTVTTLSFNSITGSLFVFPAELPVFLKEHRLGMYRADVYFLSKSIAELPWYILGPAIYTLIMYWMVGLHNTAASFFVHLCLVQLVTQCALSFGYFISTMSPSVQVATGIGPPLMMPFLLFGGFFIKDSSIPDYFIPLKYLSWFKYAFEALLIVQWDDVKRIGLGCSPPLANSTAANFCLPDGTAVLKQKGYDADNLGRNIGVLVALMVGFRLLAFLILLLKTLRK